MVTPPTLNAASPVGAVTAHSVDRVSSPHNLDTSAWTVLIRKDLPIPPTPLTNICSGWISVQWHSFSRVSTGVRGEISTIFFVIHVSTST